MASPAKKSKTETPLPDLSQIYGLHFPPEIYKFYKKLLKTSPLNPLKSIKNWQLMGPFHILHHNLNFENQVDALLFQRCYHDSPEFLTFAVSTPDKMSKLCFYRVRPTGQAIIVKVDRKISNPDLDPKAKILPTYIKVCDASGLPNCFKLAENPSKNIPKEFIKINKKSLHTHALVCPTITNLGISVDVGKNEVGYRDLQVTDKKLISIFKKIDSADNDTDRKKNFKTLLEISNNIQYANDECDFGMGYEFGYDLFHFGSKYLNKFCLKTLPLAYGLLGWETWKTLVEKHLAERKDEIECSNFLKIE